MPRKRIIWSCDKCRREYVDYMDASNCEGNHIVVAAVDGLKDRLAAILPKAKRVASRKPRY